MDYELLRLSVYAPHQPETAIYRILPAARNNESRLLIDTIIAVAENCFSIDHATLAVAFMEVYWEF